MPRQALILILALVLWALAPLMALWTGVAAYGLAWLVVNTIAVMKPALLEVPLSGGRRLLVVALVLAVPLSVLWSRRDALLSNEGLAGSLANSADRARLESTPSIAPPMVFADHPQTFYVHALGAETVELSVGPMADPIAAAPLGHGLFRTTYDPRLHGLPAENDGDVSARLVVDGEETSRTLVFVVPRPHPRWLRGGTDRRLAATTSEETDEVIVVDRGGLVRRIEVGDAPADCAFLDDRLIAVAHRFAEDLFIVDAVTGHVVRQVPLLPHQHRVAAAPGGGTLAVAIEGPEPGVFLVDARAGSVRAFIPSRADWIAFGVDEDTLIVTSRHDARVERWSFRGDGRRVDALDLGRPAVTLAVAATGRSAVIATTDYRADGSTHYGNHFVQDQLLTLDLGVPVVVDQMLTARRSSGQGSAGNVDRGVSPMGIDLLPDGSARVAFAGTSEVWHYGPGLPQPAVVDTTGVLSAPHSVFTFADGSFAVTSPADGRIAVFEPGGDVRTIIPLAPTDDVLLRESPAALARRMGERTFYEATRAGITCQSCHLHTDTDYVFRNIGEQRMAPTLSTRGLAGTAPFLRDGSYPRIRDLEELARTLFRGFARRAPGRAFTLEAFVEALPRNPSRALFTARDLNRERRGVDAFVRAGCTTCHAFPAFTNLGQHPLGALFPDRAADLGADTSLDVPSLIGVDPDGPFFTDGRATSLEEVLREHNRHNRHGNTADLGDAEIADLVHFLEAL